MEGGGGKAEGVRMGGKGTWRGPGGVERIRRERRAAMDGECSRPERKVRYTLPHVLDTCVNCYAALFAGSTAFVLSGNRDAFNYLRMRPASKKV